MEVYVREIVIVFVACIGIAHGLSCYDCSNDFWLALSTGAATTTSAKCHSPDSTVLKKTCSGQCKTVFQGNDVARTCVSACQASSSSTSDVACCSSDECNSGGPTGAGWVKCHTCFGTGEKGSCAKEGFVPDGNYEFCHGDCYKAISVTTIFTAKIKTVTRGCSSGCVQAKNSGGISGLSATVDNKCCIGDLCNTGTKMSAFVGLLLVAVTAVFTL